MDWIHKKIHWHWPWIKQPWPVIYLPYIFGHGGGQDAAMVGGWGHSFHLSFFFCVKRCCCLCCHFCPLPWFWYRDIQRGVGCIGLYYTHPPHTAWAPPPHQRWSFFTPICLTGQVNCSGSCGCRFFCVMGKPFSLSRMIFFWRSRLSPNQNISETKGTSHPLIFAIGSNLSLTLRIRDGTKSDTNINYIQPRMKSSDHTGKQ